MSVDFHISKYAKICDELRAEVVELKARLKTFESNENNSGSGGGGALVMAATASKGAVTFELQLETEKYSCNQTHPSFNPHIKT